MAVALACDKCKKIITLIKKLEKFNKTKANKWGVKYKRTYIPVNTDPNLKDLMSSRILCPVCFKKNKITKKT